MKQSLSAWRAWVEIGVSWKNWIATEVALRMESVGRNMRDVAETTYKAASLSAWRAWVEIKRLSKITKRGMRSLSAWRAWVEIYPANVEDACNTGRSPHGERG